MTPSTTEMPRLWIDNPDAGSSSGLLAAALALAGVLHLLLVLGVSFEAPEGASAQRTTRALEIVVLREAAPTQKEPEVADAYAQVNRSGGGAEEAPQADFTPPIEPVPETLASERFQAEALPPALVPPPAPDQDTERPPPALVLDEALTAAIESKPDIDPTSIPAPAPVPAPIPIPEALPEPLPEPEPIPELSPEPVAPVVTAAQILASRNLEIAELSDRIQHSSTAYANRPRRKAINASTREYKYASYLEAWRRKVERVGNLNYPQEAKRHKMYGSLILHVAVRADGSIEQIQVRRSSGFDLLDEAAVKIVELAAPFAPFPPDIRKETDVLDITRTWQFLSSNRLGWKN